MNKGTAIPSSGVFGVCRIDLTECRSREAVERWENQ
jgi:hypothetical protein